MPELSILDRAGSVSIDAPELERIPSARDPWSVLQATPGVRVHDGSGPGAADFTLAGRDEGVWHVDGVTITDPAAVGSSPTYFDFGEVEEIQVSTGGADLVGMTGGAGINIVTKRGANDIRGSGRSLFTNDSLQADNFLDADLAGSFESPKVDRILEFGGETGFPIIKDRLWVWGSHNRNDVEDAFRSPSAGEIEDAELLAFAHKLGGQTLPSNEPVAFYHRGDRPGRGEDDWSDTQTTWNQQGPSPTYKVEDQQIFGSGPGIGGGSPPSFLSNRKVVTGAALVALIVAVLAVWAIFGGGDGDTTTTGAGDVQPPGGSAAGDSDASTGGDATTDTGTTDADTDNAVDDADPTTGSDTQDAVPADADAGTDDGPTEPALEVPPGAEALARVLKALGADNRTLNSSFEFNSPDDLAQFIYSIAAVLAGDPGNDIDLRKMYAWFLALNGNAPGTIFNNSTFECGTTVADITTVCPAGVLDVPEGDLLMVAAEFEAPPASEGGGRQYTYTAAMDANGDPADNFTFNPPFDWDLYRDTDRWYVLDNVGGAWSLARYDGEFGVAVPTAARALIADDTIVWFIPRDEFTTDPLGVRVTSFRHDGSFQAEVSAADVSGGNPTEPLVEVVQTEIVVDEAAAIAGQEGLG